MSLPLPAQCSSCGQTIASPGICADCAPHSAHDTPVIGCFQCEDALAEAREALSEWREEAR